LWFSHYNRRNRLEVVQTVADKVVLVTDTHHKLATVFPHTVKSEKEDGAED
jgi:hypothetical protein